MHTIKLLALDLDGTLLNSDKELTARTRAALFAAAEAGVEIVPTTGRFFGGMPEVIRALPFVHYAITVNGAQVYDIRQDCAIGKAEMPAETALQVLSYLDGFPVIYDCYQNSWGWMTRSMQDAAAAYITDRHALQMVQQLRSPVDDLKACLRERNCGVQKLQLFTPDRALRLRLMEDLAHRFPQLSISTSMPFNVEINDAHANKGEALAQLASYLHLPMQAAMAIGDGLNDKSMIEQAGLGVAMANAAPEILAIADETTVSCDEDGAAVAIERFCIPKKA